jgi:alpha-tubulin suppressor-like RCC1 family protein
MYNLALTREGRVVAWGAGPSGDRESDLIPPAGLSNVTAIAAGYAHGLALKNDGTIVGWGRTRVPPGLHDVVAIAAGRWEWAHDLALKQDGTVVEWRGTSIENEVPVPATLSSAVAVAVGEGQNLALRRDGTVFGWGLNGSGQATGTPTEADPADKYGTNGVVTLGGQVLSNVIAVAAGPDYSLAIKQNGTVVGWGRWHGLYPVPVPVGLTNVTAIAVGQSSCLAITTNTAPLVTKK